MKLRAAVALLAAIHAAVLFAGFLSPCDPETQHREYAFAPPELPRLADLRFFVRDPAGRLHLFGTMPRPLFLLGTDGFGRDQFSRLLHGGRVSLAAGLLAAALSLGAGWLLGALAGFYGRWADAAIMRAADVFLALPWLYLLFAVRAFLPLEMPPARAFLMIVAVIGLVGWARPARLVRGVVLSARERGYVLAARGFGASDAWLLRRHILPANHRRHGHPGQPARSRATSWPKSPSPSSASASANPRQAGAVCSPPYSTTMCWLTIGGLVSPALVLIPVFAGYFLLADVLLKNHKSVTMF